MAEYQECWLISNIPTNCDSEILSQPVFEDPALFTCS